MLSTLDSSHGGREVQTEKRSEKSVKEVYHDCLRLRLGNADWKKVRKNKKLISKERKESQKYFCEGKVAGYRTWMLGQARAFHNLPEHTQLY